MKFFKKQLTIGSLNMNHHLNFKKHTHTLKELSPAPQKMIKFNPGLSQISSKVFLPMSMSLELIKYCCVFTPRFSDDNIKCYCKQYIGR